MRDTPDARSSESPVSSESSTSLRLGRAPATTHGTLSQVALDLFLEHGFDETTVDDIVRTAGIGRRTFFRYFTSKNELPWGDFSGLLVAMRVAFDAVGDDLPLVEALRRTVVSFNDFPHAELDAHRGRMSLLFSVPSLTAYSTLKYADWRQVIAEYVATRRGEMPDDLTPQAISWACLGLCLASYEQWLAHPESDLLELIDEAFQRAEHVFGRLE